eukprot:TRINITY_DN84319_c0_g1_i1.p1 TRINITY_DN84319_c0_g1~~TRINITY_DN84319_c0_g1_i1.p1  ORF type:complete len:381 (+),score=56.31 TRINITY_DN84319_c0_g1_i1:10-1152(+)
MRVVALLVAATAFSLRPRPCLSSSLPASARPAAPSVRQRPRLLHCAWAALLLRVARAGSWRACHSAAMATKSTGSCQNTEVRLAHLTLPASHVLLESKDQLSVALGDLQPILPGHSVIVPIGDASLVRLADLPEHQMLDLWHTALAVQDTLEPRHAAAASNWAVFDGWAAGQPVPHAHLHVVPRTSGDFAENDEVYVALERWRPTAEAGSGRPPEVAWPADEERRPRTGDEMAAEATAYREAFASSEGSSCLGDLPKDHEVQAFAKIKIAGSNIFFVSKSGLSVAFVNLKPLLPGHVLVTPRRVVPRMQELTKEEFDDLFRSVRLVQAMVEAQHGAKASRLGIQDGPDAGQSVPHVHVHILPIPHAEHASEPVAKQPRTS